MLCVNTVCTKSCDYKRYFLPVINQFSDPTVRDDYIKNVTCTTKLRDLALKISKYQQPTDIETWNNYYKYFMGIIKYFPCSSYLNSNLSIKWTSAISSSVSIQTPNLFVELAAILYNIASLYTQKGHVQLSANMDETMIENSFESLQKALNYINLILNEVHFNMNDKEILPELQKPYLIYLSKLIMAEMQYLKAMKARLQKGNHRRVFVVLFKGANRLYEEAISSLKKCSVELPNVLQHLNAMKELCYIQALYYEVYMSKEDLNDVEVHGTGKAFICLQLFMETVGKIRNFPTSILKPILPILDTIEPEARAQYQLIMSERAIRQSTVPTKEFVFHLDERIIVKPGDIALEEPAVSYEHLFSGLARKCLQSAIEKYENYVGQQMAELNKQYEEKVKRVNDYVSGLQYEEVVFASGDETSIPAHVLKELREVQSKEEAHHFQQCQQMFEYEKKGMQKAFTELEDIQADIIRSMNMHPERFNEPLRSYFNSTFVQYLDNYRKAVESILLREKDIERWLEYTRGNNYKLITPGGTEVLAKCMGSAPALELSMESARNKLLTSYSRFQVMMDTAKQYKLRAERISKTTYALVGDYVSLTNGMENVEDRFALYFAPCRVEMESALNLLNSYMSYMSVIAENIDGVNQEMDSISTYVRRRDYLGHAKKALDVYQNLTQFFTCNGIVCKKNKEEMIKAFESVKVYAAY